MICTAQRRALTVVAGAGPALSAGAATGVAAVAAGDRSFSGSGLVRSVCASGSALLWVDAGSVDASDTDGSGAEAIVAAPAGGTGSGTASSAGGGAGSSTTLEASGTAAG